MMETNPQNIYCLFAALHARYSPVNYFTYTDIKKNFQVGIIICIVQRANQINPAVKRRS